MRNVNCNLCGCNDYALVDSHYRDEYCEPGVEVRTVICKNCGLVYINPQIEENEMHQLYTTDYAGTRTDLPQQGRARALSLQAEARLKWLERHLNLEHTRGRVLDVGCSAGSLLDSFKKRGWDTYGVEPTPHYAEFALQKGHRVITGFIEDIAFDFSYFDLITLTQTLEHLPDPSKALIRLRDFLKSGGYIYIDVPNILKPKHWRFFEAPHLYNFSPTTLRLLLKKAGFEPIIVENRWDVKILAKNEDTDTRLDFSREGDDYKKVIHSLRSRYIRLFFHNCRQWPVAGATFLIHGLFGESRGQKIIEKLRGERL